LILGLRWGYGITQVLPYQATLAALIATLSWLSFKSLTVENFLHRYRLIGLHLMPTLMVIAELIVWPDLIGATLILIFLGYGLALFRIAWLGPDALLSTRLDGALLSYRSLQMTSIVVLASALTDILISLDAVYGSGFHAATVVAIANAFALLLLGWAASVAISGQVASTMDGEEEEEEQGDVGTALETNGEDSIIALAVETAMREKKHYKEVDLNLTRLSRKLHIPARRISEAINHIHGKSVSQYVNEFRIGEACHLLENSDMLISQIMFEAGFQTKSNFNREFLRVTGLSPRQFRTERCCSGHHQAHGDDSEGVRV
jgi:AraC-like DNA-binding protein